LKKMMRPRKHWVDCVKEDIYTRISRLALIALAFIRVIHSCQNATETSVKELKIRTNTLKLANDEYHSRRSKEID